MSTKQNVSERDVLKQPVLEGDKAKASPMSSTVAGRVAAPVATKHASAASPGAEADQVQSETVARKPR